jgi:hypothetical protein
MAVLYLTLGYEKPEYASIWSKLGRGDWIGLAIFLPASVSFLLSLIWGGTVYPWSSWNTLLPLILGTVFLGIFGFYERRVAKSPTFRSGVFSTFTSIAVQIGGCLHGVLLWLLVYYICLYYQGVRGYTPLETGIAVLPETLTVAPSAVVTSIIIGRTGYYHWAILSGWILTILGFGLFYLMDNSISVVGLVFVNLLPGVGLGMLLPAMSMAVQISNSPQDLGHAVSTLAFLRSGGQCLGVAIGSSIFTNQLYRELETVGLGPDVNTEDFLAVINGMANNDTETETLIKAKVALTGSLRMVWICACAFAAVSGLLFCFAKCPPLPKEDHIETETCTERAVL